MWELLGLDPKSIASATDYTPGEGRKKDIGDYIGDSIMSVLTGSNYSQLVEDASKTKLGERYDDVYGGRLEDVAGLKGYSALPGVGEGLADMKESDIKKELARREATKKALGTAAVTYGVDIEELKGLTDPGEILSKASGLKKDADQSEVLRQESRVDDRLAQQQAIETARLAHDTTKTNALYAHTASENNKERAYKAKEQNRRLAHESYQNNLTRQYQTDVAKYDANTKLQVAQMESADRRYDREVAREDRLASQRQASIMALVKGLTQMGAGFAI